jgi:hypothetical protein
MWPSSDQPGIFSLLLSCMKYLLILRTFYYPEGDDIPKAIDTARDAAWGIRVVMLKSRWQSTVWSG